MTIPQYVMMSALAWEGIMTFRRQQLLTEKQETVLFAIAAILRITIIFLILHWGGFWE